MYNSYLFLCEVYTEYHQLVPFILWYMSKINDLLYCCLVIVCYFEIFITFDQFNAVEGFDCLDRILFAYGQF